MGKLDMEQAKIILSAYRAGGEDSDDPVFSEALEMVHRDSELKEWFQGERNFDHLLEDAMEEVQVPKGLRESILMSEKVVMPPQRVWYQEAFWKSAAAVVFFLGVTLLLVLSGKQGGGDIPVFSSYAKDMRGVLLSSGFRLDLKAEGISKLQSYLQEEGAPAGFSLPEKLEGSKGLGCKSFEWGGLPVSLICFRNDANEVFHLFVIHQDKWEDIPDGEQLVLRQEGKWSMASWQDASFTYLLTSKVPRSTLAGMF